MRAFTTIFLDNSLRAILDHIEQTPDLDPNLPSLVEFKNTLIHQIQQLGNEDRPGTQSGHRNKALPLQEQQLTGEE